MKKLALACMILLASCVQPAWPTTRSEPVIFPEQGTCHDPAGGFVDLRRAVFFENRSVDIRDSDTTRRVRLERETLYIDIVSNETTIRTHYYALDAEINEASPPDIELKLLSLDGVIGVFWRETYQHQQYRQGVFRIEREQISRWCDGVGGVSQ